MKELTTLHALALTEEGGPLWLTYRLSEQDGRYGVHCCLEGVDLSRHPRASARADGLYPDRERGEALLRRLAAHQVTPAHLEDLIWELL